MLEEIKFTCIRRTAQPVRDTILRNIISQTAGAHGKILAAVAAFGAGVEQKLAAAGLINERADQRPQDGEDTGRPDDEDSAQCFRIVSLAYFYDVQQSFHSGPP